MLSEEFGTGMTQPSLFATYLAHLRILLPSCSTTDRNRLKIISVHLCGPTWSALPMLFSSRVIECNVTRLDFNKRIGARQDWPFPLNF